MEKPKEPGSARFGNFINYYSFNPPERRMKLIPKSLLADAGLTDRKKKIFILDIGCNAGVRMFWIILFLTAFVFHY